MRQLIAMSDTLGDADRERPMITGNDTSTASRNSPSTMRGGSIRNRTPSGGHKGGGPRHNRDEADTAGTSTLTRHKPVQSTIDDFFGQGLTAHHDRPASTRSFQNSLDMQDHRRGHSSLPESHVDGDSASDMEIPSPAEETSSDEASEWEDTATDSESEESLQDERTDWDEREADSLLEAFGELQTGGTEADSPGARNDRASKPTSPGRPTDAVVGHQPQTDTDIYSSVSGMKLVVVDCFEELFASEWEALDEARETQDAIDTGMDPQWAFLKAARAHRALKKCLHLDPGTTLYERLFTRLSSALVKAFEVRGTREQQKAVFLMEATLSFEVWVKDNIPKCYFDCLHLIPQLIDADLLVTKLIHVSFCPTQLQPTRAGSY